MKCSIESQKLWIKISKLLHLVIESVSILLFYFFTEGVVIRVIIVLSRSLNREYHNYYHYYHFYYYYCYCYYYSCAMF